MSEYKSVSNFLSEDEQPPVLTSGLNVLTILTFIGCGIAFLSGIWSFMTAAKSYKGLQEAQGKLQDAPAWAKKLAGPEMLEIARKTMENKVPMLLLTMAGVVLCTWGAIEMRKLKKQGFILWVVGEFVPLLGSFVFLGAGVFMGFALFGLIFPVLFLILYATQRKHLVY